MGEARAAWNQLFDALIAESELLAARIRDAMQAELPSYRGFPAVALDADVGVEVGRVLESARAGQAAVSESELAALAEIGERRARQGVPVDEMLRAWRIGVQVAVRFAREVGARLGVQEGAVLEFVESVLAWSDVAMVATAGGHRRAELELARAEHDHRATYVRGVLLGGLAPAELRVQAEGYNLDPERDYVAVRARPLGDVAAHTLERALGFHEAVQHRRGLSATIDGDLAGFLREPPAGEIAGVVGVGPPRPLDRLPESFRLATRALETAHALGLPGVHDVPELGLRAAVAGDHDVGEALRERYVEPLGASPSAAELKASLREYFACGM
ncbi:MAG TPA: hypothetical protein VIX82_02900, partial [Solirubrobacteraceae bacterium]